MDDDFVFVDNNSPVTMPSSPFAQVTEPPKPSEFSNYLECNTHDDTPSPSFNGPPRHSSSPVPSNQKACNHQSIFGGHGTQHCCHDLLPGPNPSNKASPVVLLPPHLRQMQAQAVQARARAQRIREAESFSLWQSKQGAGPSVQVSRFALV